MTDHSLDLGKIEKGIAASTHLNIIENSEYKIDISTEDKTVDKNPSITAIHGGRLRIKGILSTKYSQSEPPLQEQNKTAPPIPQELGGLAPKGSRPQDMPVRALPLPAPPAVDLWAGMSYSPALYLALAFSPGPQVIAQGGPRGEGSYHWCRWLYWLAPC